MTTPVERIPELVKSVVVHRGYPFDVTVDTLRVEGGGEVERSIVRHPGAVALVALDERGRWVLVRQYRHPAQRWLIEIPAGTIEAGESPEVAAARELREETGFAAASLERLGGTWMAPGFCTEYITYFLATGLSADPLPQDADEALSEPLYLTLDEMRSAVASGEIEDAKTLVTMQLMALRR
ncbi:MAG: NUDIX hydrolase [Dehalococcoidia bacterium]|nr:NUDIX hydrolase [Dehalococcoidia bacterium]